MCGTQIACVLYCCVDTVRTLIHLDSDTYSAAPFVPHLRLRLRPASPVCCVRHHVRSTRYALVNTFVHVRPGRADADTAARVSDVSSRA